MTNQSPPNLSYSWHLGNGFIGTSLVFVGTFIIAFILAILTNQPALVVEQLSMPILGVTFCCTIVFLTKRVARRFPLPNFPQGHPVFGMSFHVSNILIVSLLAFVLFLIPAIGIPQLKRPGDMDSILLWICMLAIFVFVHTIASLRAEKHITQKPLEIKREIKGLRYFFE